MKTINRIFFISFIGAFFLGIGLLIIGLEIGAKQEQDQTREKLNSCIHAPTPVEIGDTLYLIRVYPINSQK